MESMRDLVTFIENMEDSQELDVRLQALSESKRITQLIESGELSEEQLDELLGGLSALGGAAGRAIGGAAASAGQAIKGAASTAGQAIKGAVSQGAQAVGAAGQAAKQAVGNAAQGIAQTYKSGEQRAAANKALASLTAVQQSLTKLPFDPKFINQIDKMPFGRIKALLANMAK